MRNYRSLSIFALRIAMGLLFLLAGIDKLSNDFSTTGFLENATTGPFKEFFAGMAGSSVVDNLVIWGEILIGLALILGIFLRFACYMGALMMLLFYMAVLPPEHGYITEHIIYILVFVVLAMHAAGRFLGLDKYIERSEFIRKNSYLKFLLG